jgi:hypothetical protein
MKNCRAGASTANENQRGRFPIGPKVAAAEQISPFWSLFTRQLKRSRAERVDMKRYSLLLGIIIAAVACSSLLAQEKAALQPNVTVLSILQGNAGKTIELHLRSGEKIGGKVGQVTDNVVYLSHLTGAEFYDAFVDVKDISAVVIRAGGR